jgi:hypothetical protein
MVEEMNGAPVTQSKGVSDSCRYTACEQLMGSVHMSPATDVWAFAMTALQVRVPVLADACDLYSDTLCAAANWQTPLRRDQEQHGGRDQGASTRLGPGMRD